MNILVTGGTGFVGRHVVQALLDKGHCVTAVVRDIKKAETFSWFNQVTYITCDLHDSYEPIFENTDSIDVLVHLAWPGLPNFGDFFHISHNLFKDLQFLEAMVDFGIPRVIVSGTCLEYGMQYGPLSEDMETFPTTPYGLAKDTLRKSLQLLQKKKNFALQWLRLFYMYGEGQAGSSVLVQLERAIEAGDPVFNMSEGDQLRDYLSIEQVAKNVALVVESPDYTGVLNCCSGKPISIIDLVTQHCRNKNSRIQLNRGYYNYPVYEPLSFWGEPSKLFVNEVLS